jgi:hypothetical protein
VDRERPRELFGDRLSELHLLVFFTLLCPGIGIVGIHVRLHWKVTHQALCGTGPSCDTWAVALPLTDTKIRAETDR